MELFYFYVIAGVALIALELHLTTFYLLIIGIVFIFSGLLSLVINNWLIISLISGIFSIAGGIFINLYKFKHKAVVKTVVQHIGHQVEVVEILSSSVRIKYSGSYWNAKLAKKNISEIKVGDILMITKYHNNEFEID